MNLYRFNPDFPLKDLGMKDVGLTSVIVSTNCCQRKGIARAKLQNFVVI